jgi:hypothetical protein
VDAQHAASDGPGAGTGRFGQALAALIAVNAGDYDDKDGQDGCGEN